MPGCRASIIALLDFRSLLKVRLQIQQKPYFSVRDSTEKGFCMRADDIRKLAEVGQEKGNSTNGDMNTPTPLDVPSAEDVDDFLAAIHARGLDVLEGEPRFSYSSLEQRLAGESDEIDVNPAVGAPEVANDPVRVYLREMGASPLLTREGEVDIAKRIERGQLSALKALSRSSIVIHEVLEIGQELKRGLRSIEDTVVFDEEEITDEILQNRVKLITRRIDQVRKHYQAARRLAGQMATCTADKKVREYRRCRGRLGREIVRISLIVRNLCLTYSERKRLADGVNKTVETMRSVDRQIRDLEKKITSIHNEELKKNYRARHRQHRADMRRLETNAGMTFQELQGTQRKIIKGEMEAE